MDYTIILCDDIKQILSMLEENVKNFFDDTVEIITANSGEECLEKIKNKKPDIALLDVSMDEMDGFELANCIRDKHSNAVTIFLTAHSEYAVKAHYEKAFRFLLKPYGPEQLFEILKEAVEQVEKNKLYDLENQYLTVKNKDGIHKINYNDIYYFQKRLRKVDVICRSGVITYYESFKNLESSLDNDYFIRCHQGYIVNVKKIMRIEGGNLCLIGREESVPIGKTFYRRIREMTT